MDFWASGQCVRNPYTNVEPSRNSLVKENLQYPSARFHVSGKEEYPITVSECWTLTEPFFYKEALPQKPPAQIRKARFDAEKVTLEDWPLWLGQERPKNLGPNKGTAEKN